MPTFTRATRLAAPAERVWRHATTLDGINRELAPWMSMSAPPDLDGLSLDDDRVVLGEPLFASRVRLLRVLPMETMQVTLVELDRGRRFVEQSPMRTMRTWRHQREVEPDGAGCRLRDTITFEPRIGAAARPLGRLLEAFFGHRHRKLVALFGAALLAACSGGGDDAPHGPALDLPVAIALPYVEAGAGPSTIEVAIANRGDQPATGLVWSLDGDADFALEGAPDAIEAGAEAPLTIRWAGAAAERIAGATLTVALDDGALAAEVWAVAGDPAIGAADFAPVIGAGGVEIGVSAVVSMPTAPFPNPGDPWTDDRVHLFVPAGYREAAGHDLVLHFHGHSTTIDATVPGHHYREQVYASGADVILVVPQGPVEAASGDFGKLDDPAGTDAFLDEVLVVLYREGQIARPARGQTILTSHSGGYAAVARNLGGDGAPPLPGIAQVDLFDSLYGYLSTYQAYALGGGRLRSNYTSTGGTDDNNRALVDALEAEETQVATAPTTRALRDALAVIYPTAATHNGSTRDDGAFGEQLRWGARRSRRGPRVELRTATAAGGEATLTWLAPPEDDLTGFRIETSIDGVTWSLAAEAAADQDAASFPIDAGARVRVVPVVDGVALDDAQPSDVYRVDPDAEVLIVDGFDRVIDGSWGGLAHDFAARVGEAAGPVHAVADEAVTEDGFDLSGYRTVIWLVGDESTDDHTFSPAARDAIDAYLDGGGRVILSGSEIGFELGASAAGWLAATAGAAYASDDAGSGSARGAGPLASLPGFGFGGAAAPYPEEYPDTFTATGAGELVLAYGTGAGAAVGIAGRGVLVGFPLELIDDPDDLAAVMAALLGFVA